MPMSEAKRKANKRWNDENMAKKYDRISVLVPKGQKATVQRYADEVKESINEYTNKALKARMGLTEWPDVKGSEADGGAGE